MFDYELCLDELLLSTDVLNLREYFKTIVIKR